MLQVVLSLHPGGTERLVMELLKRLNTEIPSSVCCLDEAGAWGEELRRDHFDVASLKRQPGFHPRLGHAIASMARKHDVSVIHCHHYTPFVYGSLARLWSPRLRVVFTEHGRLSDAAPSRKRRLANSVLSRAPHQVFTVSADLKQHIVAEGFPDAKVGVIYNGIEVGPIPDRSSRARIRTQLTLPDDAFVVGTVARLDPVKDLDVLIRSAATVNQHHRTILLVIGDGERRQHLEATAAAIGAGDAVRFLGHRDDARDLLAGCDVYANSSVSEGVSLTILEAMAAGLPVVATAVGGTPEVLDDTCARLVPARDPEAMAAALLALATAPDLCAALGRAGRERVETRFTIERMVREYRDAYIRAAAA